MPDKASEITAMPVLTERLSEGDGLKGALVSIDAIAIDLVRSAPILSDVSTLKPQRRPEPGAKPRPTSLRLRRRMEA